MAGDRTRGRLVVRTCSRCSRVSSTRSRAPRDPRFSGYRVPRFTEVPPIQVVLLDRDDMPPAGAGENPMIAVAPALASATFTATGHRLRSLPMLPALTRLDWH
jgi:CO/xanthine dehydrogenase Mo-binding subunit